jgi:hypothetical protein
MPNMLIKDLLVFPKGTRITVTETCNDIENYVYRSDTTSALRKRLELLSKRGKFRMVDLDTWERT